MRGPVRSGDDRPRAFQNHDRAARACQFPGVTETLALHLHRRDAREPRHLPRMGRQDAGRGRPANDNCHIRPQQVQAVRIDDHRQGQLRDDTRHQCPHPRPVRDPWSDGHGLHLRGDRGDPVVAASIGVLALGIGDGHRLHDLGVERDLPRRRAGDGHKACSRPMRTACSQHRRAGLAGRTGNDEHVTRRPLVAADAPPRQEWRQLMGLDPVAQRPLYQRRYRDTDVDHLHASHRSLRVQDQAKLERRHGGGDVRTDGYPADSATVRVQSRREIHRHPQRRRGVHGLDRRCSRAGHVRT